MSNGSIYCCRIADPGINPQLVSEIFSSSVENTVLRIDLEDGKSYHECYASTRAEAGQIASSLRKLYPMIEENGISLPETAIVRLDREDWAESWKKFFHTKKISDRIVVKPTWEDYLPEKGDEVVVDIDPGMSFGTGNHPTTQFCLELMDCSARDFGTGAFLDAGCGSGILAVAAVKLGYSPVFAIDNDPEALKTSTENLVRNGIPLDACRLECADFASFRPGLKFRLIAANILSEPLMRHRDSLISLLKKDGHLVLSGIMRNEYESVRKAYEDGGLRESLFLTDENWAAGRFSFK